MTINVTTDAIGHPVATVASAGTGYLIGDSIVFNPPDSNGDSITLRIDPTVTQSTLPSGFKNWTPNTSYPLILQSSSTGSGTGMGVSVTVDASGNPTATLLDPGIKESPGDVVTFAPPDGVGDPISVTITGQVYTQLYSNKPGYKIGDTVTFNPPDGVGSPLTVSLTGLTTQQQLNFNWTGDQAFASVAPVSTSGSGTGLTVGIVVDDQGIPLMSLNQIGTGYALGDIVTFNPPSDGADSIEGMIASLGTITQLAGAKWTKGASFESVPATSTTGGGTGMTVAITVDADGNPGATLVNGGTGYKSGDRISFAPPDGVGDPLNVQFSNLQAGMNAPVISSRTIATGGDPTTAASAGNSGSISLNAPQITLGQGTLLLANATNGFSAGDVTFTSTELLNAEDVALSPFKTHNLKSSIQLSGATVRGANVQMVSDASTDTFFGYDIFGGVRELHRRPKPRQPQRPVAHDPPIPEPDGDHLRHHHAERRRLDRRQVRCRPGNQDHRLAV